MAKKLRKMKTCLNCGARVGNSNYCAHCGQLNTNKQVPIKHFFHDFLGDYFTFDSKFFKSFIPLIGKPGFLTNEYNQGRRSRYILPLRLYIFTTFMFFLVITLNNKVKDLNDDTTDNIEVIANQDSLEFFFENYPAHFDSTFRVKVAHDLYSNFEITYLKPENEDSVLNKLDTIIGSAAGSVEPNIKTRLKDDLFLNFKFGDKFKNNKERRIKELQEYIAYYSEQFDQNTRNNIISKLDSSFKIERVSRKRSVGSIKIFNEETDSKSGKFTLFLESKIKKIVSRGDEGETKFLSEMVDQIPKVLFILLPIFALLMKLFYIRHKILYINHLVFSVHLHTIFFIYILVPIFFSNEYVILAIMLALWVHTFISFRNVYLQSWVKTFFKMNTIMFIYTFILMAGIILLLFLAIFNI